MAVKIEVAGPNMTIVLSGTWAGQSIYFALPLDVAGELLTVLQEQISACQAAQTALAANPLPAPVVIPSPGD